VTRARGSGLLLAAGVVLAGLNLRIAVASVPPVVDELERALALSSAAAGLLTSAPVLCFGLLAAVAPGLTRRFGAERVLLVALLPILVGVLVRAAPSIPAVFGGTLLAGAGIAVGNVVVPAVIKGRFQARAGLLTGLYAGALGVGAALAAGLTVPVADVLGGGLQTGLAIWAIPAAVAVAVLAAGVLRDRRPAAAGGVVGPARALLRDALACQVTLFMGLQSLVFYAGLAWIPAVLRDEGYTAAEAGAALSVYALAGIPAAVVTPVLATRMRDQRALAAAIGAIDATAIAGLLLAPSAAFGWVALFGVGQGAAIALALTLFVLRAPDPMRTAQLSGMAQTIGYVLAAVGPLALGGLHDTTGDWDAPLAVLLAVTAPLAGAGIAAGRSRTLRPSAAIGR
jgi:CP family cyanate transporter-like MFS transporter